MRKSKPYSVRRVPVLPEPWVQPGHDYADAFELRLADPDSHTAEEWLRTAIEQAAPGVRATVRFVHRRVAGFSLSTEPHSILGWDIVSSSRDAIHIATRGPSLRAEIVMRRTSDTTATVSTFLFYGRNRMRLMWLVIGPLHRRVVPYLLARAAAHMTKRTRPVRS